jgi:aspartyl-tRNA(Asn)/glutamyl-tRNA(Gln) amidotransferase subunit A
MTKPIIGLTIGVPAQARSAANHPDVTRVLNETIVTLQRIGATVVDVDLPMTDYGIAAYYVVAAAEASSNLARFDGIRYGRRASLEPGQGLVDLYCRSRSEGFGKEVQRRIMLGTYVLSSGYYDAYYNTALKARRLIKQDYDTCFAGTSSHPACHAVLMPAAPGPAFKIGEKASDPLALYLEDVYTVGVNLAGLPGLTVPAGWTSAAPRLPIGMQLIGRGFDELTLLRIAAMLKSLA